MLHKLLVTVEVCQTLGSKRESFCHKGTEVVAELLNFFEVGFARLPKSGLIWPLGNADKVNPAERQRLWHSPDILPRDDSNPDLPFAIYIYALSQSRTAPSGRPFPLSTLYPA